MTGVRMINETQALAIRVLCERLDKPCADLIIGLRDETRAGKEQA